MQSPESGLCFPVMETEGISDGYTDHGCYGVGLIRSIVMPLGLSFG
jgi:hypothetical protein